MSIDKIKRLEERTVKLARDMRAFLDLPATSRVSEEDKRQVIRSSGSVGANYIEANEAVSAKDFLLRIKISRKEARETHFWLTVIKSRIAGEGVQEHARLLDESLQLTKIFSSVILQYTAKLKGK